MCDFDFKDEDRVIAFDKYRSCSVLRLIIITHADGSRVSIENVLVCDSVYVCLSARQNQNG